MEITRQGFFKEYEVKVTRADFFADSGKSKRLLISDSPNKVSVVKECLKHGLLKARHWQGPSQFWYITPEGLVYKEEIPEYAGCLTFDGQRFNVLKRAPRLHKHRMDDSVARSLFTNTYFRYWGYHAKRVDEILKRYQYVEKTNE